MRVSCTFQACFPAFQEHTYSNRTTSKPEQMQLWQEIWQMIHSLFLGTSAHGCSFVFWSQILLYLNQNSPESVLVVLLWVYGFVCLHVCKSNTAVTIHVSKHASTTLFSTIIYAQQFFFQYSYASIVIIVCLFERFWFKATNINI